jgi:hypothetical protein
MVFNTAFNNISVISWRSVLLVEETGEDHRPVANHWQTYNVVLSIPGHEGDSNLRRGKFPIATSLHQSSEWKFEITGPNQILEFILYIPVYI